MTKLKWYIFLFWLQNRSHKGDSINFCEFNTGGTTFLVTVTVTVTVTLLLHIFGLWSKFFVDTFVTH